jgi:hypothetical protein
MSEPTTQSLNSNSLEQGKDTKSYNIDERFEALNEEIVKSSNTSFNLQVYKGMLTVKTGNQWMQEARNRPIPKMLFGEFFFESELCILFADTNLGKSILAVQIGNSISIGEQIKGFKLEAKKQPVLYFDFELSDKQFENRYSNKYQNHYNWDDNFIRIEINPDAIIPEGQSFEEYMNFSIEKSINDTGAKILIIDNLTYLKSATESAKDALPLMKHLKALKSKYFLSIMVLAHTPKRDLSKPITRNDLQGSKMLINFCDSSFSIGESHSDKNLRYLKQIKQRNTEQIYDAENVCVCQIDKPDNFLMFEFVNYGSEWEHLKQRTENDKESLNYQVIELNQKGLSLREIGSKLSISHMKAKRILNDIK